MKETISDPVLLIDTTEYFTWKDPSYPCQPTSGVFPGVFHYKYEIPNYLKMVFFQQKVFFSMLYSGKLCVFQQSRVRAFSLL